MSEEPDVLGEDERGKYFAAKSHSHDLKGEDLCNFNGTEQYHRLSLGSLVATDGVLYVCEHGGAFWLSDAISSWQPSVRKKQTDGGAFQVWELNVNLATKKAVLTCRPDSGEKCSAYQEIEHTDFPLSSIKLYVEGNVLLLPSEH